MKKNNKTQASAAASNNQSAPAIEEPSTKAALLYNLETPVAEWTEEEVIAFCEQKNIAVRNTATMDETELAVLARHGAIIANRRHDAERRGQEAAVEAIRRAVTGQVNRQATFNFLIERMGNAMTNVRRGIPNEPNVVVTIAYGDISVALTAEEVVEAVVNKTNPMLANFESQVKALLQTGRQVAHQRRLRIENPPGGKKWAAYTSDIRASLFEQQFRESLEQ